jgi:hypothetical protein
VQTATRNATLADLVAMLSDQHTRKLDMVVPASQLRAEGGNLVVANAEAQISAEGVTSIDGVYRPTDVADEGIATKLGIPLSYVRRMRAERADLWDANVNGWLAGGGLGDADTRSFLLRAFRGEEGGQGIARAVLSDKFGIFDNLDALTATMAGVREAGVDVQIQGCDLNDRRMYVRLYAPGASVMAPALLGNYRSPFSGNFGSDNPTVWAGFELKNSEVGGGAYTINPRLVAEVCTNGMTIVRDGIRAVHLGARMDEGLVDWSRDTQEKQLAVIQAKARDAVATFLNPVYVQRIVDEMSAMSGVKIADPAETIKVVGKKLAFSEDAMAGILGHFIQGADVTAGGVMHAVTSWAQTVDDAEAASDLEGAAFKAMELAASAA